MKVQIDSLAYTNRLRSLPPGQKLSFASILFILSAIAHPLVQVLIAIWMSIWTVIYAGIPARTYFKLVYAAIFFWLTSLPALVINITELISYNLIQKDAIAGLSIGSYYLYLSHHGIFQAASIFTRALASLSCLYFLMLTVPFSEILQTLRRIGCPLLITEILLLMYRFTFVLLNTANEIWIAQTVRGGYSNFSTSMKSLALLIGQLLKRTFDSYHQVLLSLRSRGFTGELQVWHSYSYRQSYRYLIEATIGCISLIILDFFENGRIFTRI
ncbi:cobalt transport protein [Calothrix sp. NIES-4101]|nr:cobalt transport protein [Calothrix sp. NIES-4101]